MEPQEWSAVRLLSALLVATGLAGAEPYPMLLSKDMPGKSYQGPLPAATTSQQKLAARLKADVTHLAGTIGERNLIKYPQLLLARDFIRREWESMGYTVKPQAYRIGQRDYENLECLIPGQSRYTVVVGAHYDSASGCPAADDNGSGVAALLALSRHFKQRAGKPRHSLRLVAFVNEEPPHFVASTMGSLVYARHCQKRADKIKAMLSLETLGYYSDQPGSQKYPPPLNLAYPSKGNFIAFVGNLESGPLVQRCLGTFRKNASFPSEGAALSDELPGVGWSDHWSFWQIGVPALMVTDTAPFRNPHYHQSSDTPEKLDYLRMARVVEGLQRVVEDLIDRD